MNERNNDVLREGTILSQKYRLVNVLGRGGFGITYLAEEIQTGKKIAIKEYYPKQCVFRDIHSGEVQVIPEKEAYYNHMYTRFIEEGKCMYRLRTVRHMLQVSDVFRENATAYIVMEYLEGMDLSHYLEYNGRMTWDRLSSMLRVILMTMDEIHRKGLIHRDISPDNIFLTHDGIAKLIDYGSLRTYDADSRYTTVLKHSFAPYEQYSSQGRQGPWTDIYALSVSVYYALTGILPQNSPDRMLKDSVTPLDRLRDDLPIYVSNVIAKGMAVRIEDRYQSAIEMYRALFVDHFSFYLRGLKGVFAHKQVLMQPGQEISLGRSKSSLVIYPSDTPGVSRNQCSIMVNGEGNFMVRDNGSTYGTVADGRSVSKEVWIELTDKSRISFGNEEYCVIKEEKCSE